MDNLKEQVEEILSEKRIYFVFSTVNPSNFGLKSVPKEEFYEVGPFSNYNIIRSSQAKAISESATSRKVYLEDVLVNGSQIEEGNQSSYLLEIKVISEDEGKVKIEGLLVMQIEHILSSQGNDYSNKTLTGYVKKIEIGHTEVKLKLPPEFDF